MHEHFQHKKKRGSETGEMNVLQQSEVVDNMAQVSLNPRP